MAYSTHDISRLQKTLAPSVYGPLDLDIVPERFRTELGENSILRGNPRYEALLADTRKVELFRQLTLMGDPLADAFAAKIPEIGFPRARAMVERAAELGIDAVSDAPAELVALMRSMEETPDWVDWDKIDRAGDDARLMIALAGEAIVRVAFMMTYVNGYQGLPMVITGALTSDSAAKRMKETVSTFKLAALPDALRRGGVAYKSAVMVRVMHAMVRTSLLRRPQTWDYRVYGVPIPQVDQMGAAFPITYRYAQYALARGGRFNDAMGASVEITRRLASLLGMHDQFLSNDPAQIVETWQMCQVTLRHQTDPRGRLLNDATLNAYRRRGRGRFDRALHEIDVRATRFMYTQMVGRRTALAMGVDANSLDALAAAAELVPAGIGFGALSVLKRIGPIGERIDARSIVEIERQLAKEGSAEYRTDERTYRDPGVRPSATLG